MKLEIYGEEKPAVTPTRLKLVQRGSEITVIAVNKDGVRMSGGDIVTFTSAGRIYKCRSVDKMLGFDLDANGRVTEDI